MSKQLRLDVAQLTDVGRKRSQNEDNMAYVMPKDGQVMASKGALFIVADGMGGHAAGEVASEIAVDTVTNIYYQQEDNDDVPLSLTNAIRRANALIHQRAAENMLRSGMGTTCVAAVLRGNMAYIANVGDSRAYLVRHGLVKQVSQDHSWVEEQVRAGLLTKEQARSHGQRNVITRCLGTQAEVDIDIFSEPLEEGDSLVLCTDGLSGSINEDELRVIVDKYMPQESVYYLVERANENGGPDNITAIVVRALEVGVEPPNVRRPVHAGGREVDEDTAIINNVPGSISGMSTRLEDGRMSTSSLRISNTDPLFSSANSITAPQPSLTRSRKRRGRLLYPSLAILILFMVALVGGGIYFFLFLRLPVDVDTTLNQAQAFVQQAKSEQSTHPADAITSLSHAQGALRSLQNTSSMTPEQRNTFTSLQNQTTATFQQVVVNYNVQGKITSLNACSNATSSTLTGGTPALHPNLLATILDDTNNPVSYVRGDDNNLYQLNAQNSATKSTVLNGNAVVLMTSDTQHLFALTKSPDKTAPAYTLHALAQVQGNLKDGTPATIDAGLLRDGWVPKLMTVAHPDIFVVLTSLKQPNLAMILNYNTDNLNNAPQTEKISISVDVLSVAALQNIQDVQPGKQLFLLFSNGTVQSFPFIAEGATGSQQQLPQAVPVQNAPILTPLAASGQNFTFSTSIATPMALQSPQFLSVPGATSMGTAFLVSGIVDGAPRLYIMDNTNHRIIDLAVVANSSTATTVATPSATATVEAPGGKAVDTVNAASVSVQLKHQYVSGTILPGVKSMLLDPKVTQLTLLTQSSTIVNRVALDLHKDTCPPTH